MKFVKQFENKKVLVLGLAKSGESAARLLDRLGAIVTVNDGKPFEENPAAQSLLEEGIKVVTGGHPLELLDEDFAVMVKNPGIPYTNPMVEKALEKGIPVLTEVELAYLISDAPIIGITGSNGKTTTTTMIGEVLTLPAKVVYCLGISVFQLVKLHKQQQKRMFWSWNCLLPLMGIEAFHPEIAVITNLMPTHIDYHGSFENYVAAKWNLQKNMTEKDVIVLNFNQDLAKELATKTKARYRSIFNGRKVDGAYLEDGLLKFKGEAVMRADELGVPGSHKCRKCLSNDCGRKVRGVENEVIKETLSAFGGVKHRLQYVDEIQGVKFYNDSKSTNILATQKALSGFDNSKVILIAGGLDRGNEFDELVPHITGLKEMVILGESAPRVKRAADKAGVSYVDAADVADAQRKVLRAWLAPEMLYY